jgi:hypothetical protein
MRRTMNLFVFRTWLEAKFAKDERGASMDQVNSKFNDAGSKLSSSGK